MHNVPARSDLRIVDPIQVCDAFTVLSNTVRLRETAAILHILGDANRLNLLLALYHAGDLCVSDLAIAVGMSDSAVSHSLRLLRAHGVVSAHREGRFVRYRIESELTIRLLEVISERVVGDIELHAHGAQEPAT